MTVPLDREGWVPRSREEWLARQEEQREACISGFCAGWVTAVSAYFAWDAWPPRGLDDAVIVLLASALGLSQVWRVFRRPRRRGL